MDSISSLKVLLLQVLLPLIQPSELNIMVVVTKIPEFTVYDASFNVEKTFSTSLEWFKSNLVPMKALADFKTKEVLEKGYEKESY